MEVYIESMTRITIIPQPWQQHVVRVWRQEEEWTPQTTEECQAAVIKKLGELPRDANQYDMAIAILELDRMNAVEVLDNQGNGPVLYKNWP